MSYAFRKNKKAKSWDTYYVPRYTGTALDNQVVKDKSITSDPLKELQGRKIAQTIIVASSCLCAVLIGVVVYLVWTQ